jgi:cytochrome c biogenesis protein CcmG, thiol:disulfide interchange protein DsbE
MKRLLLLMALLTALPLTACGGSGHDAAPSASAADTAATFRLASLDGGEVGPADFAGKVVLVDFWATWCIPCHAQAEVLKGIYAELDGAVEFLAVDVGEEEARVRGFVDERPFPYPVLLDPSAEVADALGVTGLPTLMILDTEGRVSYLDSGVLGEREICQELAAAGSTRTC